jgi:secondary thiamine-phosphate synthase enzyme
MVRQIEFELHEMRRGFHLITSIILNNAGSLPENGLLNIMLKHTSAAVIINENADPDVRTDFESFMNKLVTENEFQFSHTLEGFDDMPAHIKSSLFGQSITIPISRHSLNLGIWQGIYLCEFRNYGGPRSIVLSIID